MISGIMKDVESEVDRLLSMPKDAREQEGIYAEDKQLKLIKRRIQSPNEISGLTKFVADFASLDSDILRLVDKAESGKR